MKIKIRYLKLSGAYNKNGKEVPNKELEKLLLYSNKSIMQQLLKFIQNDLTTKQIEKMFRKVKKLKIPDFASVDLKETTYLSWDDIGSQSKFMIIATEQGFTGLHGHVSTEVKKGICPLCQHEGNVSMFLSLTKSNGDGTYTKRGNYICRDSQRCNQQMEQPANLHDFVSLLQMKDK